MVDPQALGRIERLLGSHPALQQAAFSGIAPAIAKELTALGLHDVDPLLIARLGALTSDTAIDAHVHNAQTHIPPAISREHHASTHVPPAISREHQASTHVPPAVLTPT